MTDIYIYQFWGPLGPLSVVWECAVWTSKVQTCGSILYESTFWPYRVSLKSSRHKKENTTNYDFLKTNVLDYLQKGRNWPWDCYKIRHLIGATDFVDIFSKPWRLTAQTRVQNFHLKTNYASGITSEKQTLSAVILNGLCWLYPWECCSDQRNRWIAEREGELL